MSIRYQLAQYNSRERALINGTSAKTDTPVDTGGITPKNVETSGLGLRRTEGNNPSVVKPELPAFLVNLLEIFPELPAFLENLLENLVDNFKIIIALIGGLFLWRLCKKK
jgi:hypothetical protein